MSGLIAIALLIGIGYGFSVKDNEKVVCESKWYRYLPFLIVLGVVYVAIHDYEVAMPEGKFETKAKFTFEYDDEEYYLDTFIDTYKDEDGRFYCVNEVVLPNGEIADCESMYERFGDEIQVLLIDYRDENDDCLELRTTIHKDDIYVSPSQKFKALGILELALVILGIGAGVYLFVEYINLQTKVKNQL